MGEKVEIVAYRCGNSGRHWNLRKMLPRGWIFAEPLMTVAQHERIVAGLEARFRNLGSRQRRGDDSSDLSDLAQDNESKADEVLQAVDAFLAQTAEVSR